MNPKFLTNPFGLGIVVGASGAWCDNKTILNACEIAGQIIRNPLREVLLFRFVAKVLEWQHNHREAMAE